MRWSAPALWPRRWRSATGQNFQQPLPARFVFGTRRARIRRGPLPRRLCRRSRNSLRSARYSGHRLFAKPVLPESAAAQPARCFRRRNPPAASRALRRFPKPEKCLAPEFFADAVTRGEIPPACAVLEFFPCIESLRWYHIRLRLLNAFAGTLRVLVNGRGGSPCYRMSPCALEKCCPCALDIVS